jgi:hypothetical protein
MESKDQYGIIQNTGNKNILNDLINNNVINSENPLVLGKPPLFTKLPQ